MKSMNVQIPGPKSQISSNNQVSNRFDLQERTLEFGKRTIHLVKALPRSSTNLILGDQVLRSGTSMGANYREADACCTKKDFKFKIAICLKEAKETVYWLRLIMESSPEIARRIEPLLKEAGELVKIFATIYEKSK